MSTPADGSPPCRSPVVVQAALPVRRSPLCRDDDMEAPVFIRIHCLRKQGQTGVLQTPTDATPRRWLGRARRPHLGRLGRLLRLRRHGAGCPADLRPLSGGRCLWVHLPCHQELESDCPQLPKFDRLVRHMSCGNVIVHDSCQRCDGLTKYLSQHSWYVSPQAALSPHQTHTGHTTTSEMSENHISTKHMTQQARLWCSW